MTKLDEIKRLAQSGDFAKAQELYHSFMNEMFVWDEKDQLFRRKDAPQQITLSKEQYDDFINHHFKEWCGSQKRSLMKDTANQSSIVVLHEGKPIDVKSEHKDRSERKSLQKSQNKQSKQQKEEEDEHFLSDNEVDELETETIIQSVSQAKKSASRRKDLSRARDDVPTIKSSQVKLASSHKLQDVSNHKIVESVSVKQSESSIAPFPQSQSRSSSVRTNDDVQRPSTASRTPVADASTVTSANKQSRVDSSALRSERQSAQKAQSAMKQSEVTPITPIHVDTPLRQSQHRVVESSSISSKKTEHSIAQSAQKTPNENDDDSQKAPSARRESDISETSQIDQISQKAPSAQRSQTRVTNAQRATSSTKQTLGTPEISEKPEQFEPASYVKKVYEEEVKSVPASSQKINKSQRPDKGVLIAFQSLLYPPMEVTRSDFESYKNNNSELLFNDPITGYPFIILRNKKANSVCRVFATGDALTTQQNSFGLKNLYESRYLMRNFIRDISTIRTLSSTLSVSAQKLM